MCGIAGIISVKGDLHPSLIEKMTQIVNHRGPDDLGFLLLPENGDPLRCKNVTHIPDSNFKCLLGHRRLSILDLSSSASQPMEFNNKYWIIYNGEIFNYIELRRELSLIGYSFKTNSDTEVILAAYDKWGMECLPHFNGMWAFVIYDHTKEILWGSIDRYGIKPFFYYFNSHKFCFSSEIKQLLSLPFIERKADIGAVFDFLAMGSDTDGTEQTMFFGIKHLRPGFAFRIELRDVLKKGVEITKWYDIDKSLDRKSLKFNDAKERFIELFKDSVKIRLRSDVPIGTALSGGLDSSGIVCVIDALLKQENITDMQRTFSIGSELAELGEIKFVQEVLKQTSVRAFFDTPKGEELFEDFDRLIYHLEYPFQSASCYASWRVYKLAKQNGVTVTLDGQGADEILGGYYNYMYPYLLIEDIARLDLKKIISDLRGLKKIFHYSFYQQITVLMKKIIISSAAVQRMYHKYRLPKNAFLDENFIKAGFENSYIRGKKAGTDKLRGKKSFYYLQKNNVENLLVSLLRIADRTSMAHSVEARVPFLDHRLVEFTLALPTDLKIYRGTTKYIYRQAMKNILPESIRTRIDKLGFVTAQEKWLFEHRLLISRMLKSQCRRFQPLLKKNAVETLLAGNLIGANQTLIWRYLCTGLMFEKFKIDL